MKRKIAVIAAALAAVAIGVAVAIATASGQVAAKALVVNPANSGRPNVVVITRKADTRGGAAKLANAAARSYVGTHRGARLLAPAMPQS